MEKKKLTNLKTFINIKNIKKMCLHWIYFTMDLRSPYSFQFIPTGSTSIIKAMKYIGNPYAACNKIYSIMQQLMVRIKKLKSDPKANGQE